MYKNFLIVTLMLTLIACGGGGGGGGSSPDTPSTTSPSVTFALEGAQQAAVRVVRLNDNTTLFENVVKHNETLTLPSTSAYRIEVSCSSRLPAYSRTVSTQEELAAALTLSLRYAGSTFTDAPTSDTPDPRYLRAVDSDGQQINQIKDRNGNKVQLRGTNLGGWLVPENWMNGFTGLDNDIWMRFALQKLEERFGEAEADRLMNIWQDHWITSKDMDRIKDLGFNTVRVPFGWRNLQKADGSWRRNDCGEIDFSRFDWIVAEAKKRDMYVVFDLHNWQSWKPLDTKEATTDSEHLLFFDKTEQPEKYALATLARAQAAALWTEIARHFKGHGTVAGFDVVNEPTGSYQYIAHQPFYAAIRKEDPERLAIMKWIVAKDLLDSTTNELINHPAKKWTNIAISDHHYIYSNSTEAADLAALDQRIADERITEVAAKYPYYVAETKDSDQTYTSFTNSSNPAEWLARTMDTKGWHWTTWTYKTVNMGGWGLYVYGTALNVNLATDSAAAIAAQWQRLSNWQNNPVPDGDALSARTRQTQGFGYPK